MAIGGQVLSMLCPNIEWTITGDDWDTIVWHNGEAPITKKQFQDGFAQFDAFVAEQENSKIAAKQSAMDKLTALGLTADEVAALIP